MSKRLYCPSCGVDVETFVMMQGGDELAHCAICGLVLDDGKKTQKPVSGALKYVLVAEDTASIRQAVASTLEREHIALEVGQAGNGVEFISQATTKFKEGGR